jgi:phosphoglycerate dehydrogenase-like enzyme
MTTPLVAILSPTDYYCSEPAALVENEILGAHAVVKTFRFPMEGAIPEEALTAAALMVWHNVPLPAAVIERLPNCRVIIRNGVGCDAIDLKAAAARNIPVCNIPDYGTEEVADHAIALTLALCRQLFPLDAEAKRLGWRVEPIAKLRRLSSLTFGLVGLGAIGTAAALRAKALGFRVQFFDPFAPTGSHKAIGITRVATLDELLAGSDVVSIHCPLTPKTRGMIGAPEIARMCPGSFLVNTARGDIVQKAAVFAALRRGHLAGAGLDVVENEPLRTAEEAATPNLIATCHAAFFSVEGMIEMRTSASHIARAALLGEPVRNRVN